MAKTLIHKMNPHVKMIWVAALRSKLYNQGREVMHRDRGNMKFHCVLGVLTDLYTKLKGDLKWEMDYDGNTYKVYKCDKETCTLPFEVMSWAGLKYWTPTVKYKGEYRSLIALNDKDGLNFNQLATLINRSL